MELQPKISSDYFGWNCKSFSCKANGIWVMFLVGEGKSDILTMRYSSNDEGGKWKLA